MDCKLHVPNIYFETRNFVKNAKLLKLQDTSDITKCILFKLNKIVQEISNKFSNKIKNVEIFVKHNLYSYLF